MANNAAALYDAIFGTLQQLRDKENPMEIERAKAIATVAQTAINLAKVEVEHLKIQGGNGVQFIESKTGSNETPQLPTPHTTTHRIR